MKGILIFNLEMDCLTGTLFDDSGSEAIIIEKNLKLNLNEEYAEQDPEQWYGCITEIITKIQELDTGIEIEAIAITYKPGTFVCIGRDGRHLANAVLPCDRRAKYQIHMCEKKYKRHNSNFYVPWKMMILPKVQWIKYNKPDIYKKTFKILTPDGYLAYRLAGETSIDCFSALFMGYDLESNCYNSKLINSLELDESMFPPVKKPGECIGMIAGDKKGELKLKDDVKVIIVSSSLLSYMEIANVLKKGTLLFDFESSDICFSDEAYRGKGLKEALKLPFKDKSIYYMTGDYESNFIKWISSHMSKQNREVFGYTPGSNGIMVLPYMMGTCKLYGSDIKGTILGIGNNDAADMLTASYEALGYIINERLEYLSYYGINVESLEIISSLKDEMFIKIITDITSKNVSISSAKQSYNRIIYKIVKGLNIEYESNEGMFAPDVEMSAKYKQLYGLYEDAVDSLNGLYRHRRKVLKRISL